MPRVLLLALALLLVPAQDALARGDDRDREDAPGAERDRGGHERGRRNARDAAAERARREGGGRVLSIQERDRGEGDGYRAKILTPDGVVRYLDVRP